MSEGYQRPPRYESFARVLRDAILQDFGSQQAFAKALGPTPGQISHYLSGEVAMKPESLRRILNTLRIPALQRQVHEAWVREFAPLPEVPVDQPAEKVIEVGSGFVAAGVTHRAISFAEQALRVIADPVDWHRVAERLVPWRLRAGHISGAWALTDSVERRARARQDALATLSALAMKGTVLRQIETVTPSAIGKASEAVFAEIEAEQGATRARAKNLVYRKASALREHAVHLLFLIRLRKISRSHLADAQKSVERSLLISEDPVIQAAGLEVRSRIEYELGQIVAAECTLDEVRALGHDQAFELWEKTSCTNALILLARGERDEAISLLESVRDACHANGDYHHFRQADQLLAHILASI